MRFRRSFLLVLFAFLFLSAQSEIALAQTAGQLLERAKTAIEKKEYEQATKDLTAIIALEPNNSEAYAQRSRAYYLSTDLKNALADAENAIRLNNKNVVALNIRGLIKVSQKDTDLALADFTSAVNADPKYAKAYLNRARIMRSRKEYDKAIIDFTSAINADPKSGYAYLSRGLVYLWDKADYQSAVTDFSKAIDLDSKDKEAYVRRADAYLQLKDYGRAISDANRALKVAADYATAYYTRGLIYSFQSKPDFAASIADFTKVIELKDPVSMADAYRYRSNLHNSFDKDYAAAITDANEAIKLNPNTANSYEVRGFAEAQLKMFTEAEKDYRLATKMNPANAHNFGMLGFINDNLGNGDQAIADARQSMLLDANNETAKKNLSILLAKYPSDKVAAQMKLISEPFKQLFDPTKETSHERIEFKTDTPFKNETYSYVGIYSFTQPINRLVNIQLALTGIGDGESMGHNLADTDEFLLRNIPNKTYSNSNIQYVVHKPLNHHFEVKIASARQNVRSEFELATMDIKYLKYDSRWDIFNQIMFFLGNGVTYNAYFNELTDENGELMSKNPRAKYSGAESGDLEWSLAKYSTKEEATQAKDILFVLLKKKLDASKYEITKEIEGPFSIEVIKIYGLPRMGFLRIKVLGNELQLATT